MDSQEPEEIAARRICCDCVEEPFLSNEILTDGTDAECYYCEEKKKTISIGELASWVESALNEHYHRTPIEPEGYEVQLQKEGSWERKGDPIAFVITEAASVDEEVAEDMRIVLEDQNYDVELAQMGEEGPYDSEAQYEEKGPDDIEFQLNWASFEHGIKTASRFFSRSAQTTLDSIFTGVSGLRTRDGRPVIVKAGPGETLQALYRARFFQSYADLKVALERPDLHLGPPPWRLALSGRMNPQGISVFYGATTEDIAVSEVRPPVGAKVATARFNVIRPIQLLDVEALRDVLITGSIFDSSFIRRLEHARFLERLSSRISQPVMPSDEPFDYLVTQAIAEYLSVLADPRLDGIIFRSAQIGGDKRNVVLFHHSARVKTLEVPKGAEIHAHFGSLSDEPGDIYYAVWEELPKPSTPEPENVHSLPILTPSLATPFDSMSDDGRLETLEVDPVSVAVHHIQSVAYSASRFSVDRHRTTIGTTFL